MQKKLPVIFLLLLSVMPLIRATGQQYNYQSIAHTLLSDAHAVVRESHYTFTIHDIQSATLEVTYAITILDEKGRQLAPLMIPYDKQRKVKDIACRVFDRNGELIKKVRSKEIEDFSNAQGSLFEDNRVKYFEFVSGQYPYTISYSYRIAYDGLLHYPVWQPQWDFGLAVENSVFTVTTPKEMAFRYKEVNINQKPDITDEGDQITYEWTVGHLPPADHEPWSPFLSERTPVVFTAPNAFKFEGYQGNMATWEAFGKWVYQLNSGRDHLPEDTKKEVQKLTAGLTEQKQIIKKLYEYMQAKTRYVSIQLGIGGYQPFDAATVDQLGYGDCKALSNYMQALLKAVNIKSYYTLVKAGKFTTDIHTDFPSTQFNHAILCVPVEMDTLWLECTSQTNPFGFLGFHTSDRDVLVIDEKGGYLARTPKYSQRHNLQARTASVIIQPDGNGTAEITTYYSGLQYEHIEGMIDQPVAEQRKLIYAKTGVSSFDLRGYDYKAKKAQVPVMKEVLKMNLTNYANVSGKRLFFYPNLLNKLSYIPPKTDGRRSDIIIRFAYHDTDTITYQIPEELHAEYVPEAVSIKSQFGEYTTEYTIEGGQIVYIRNLTINSGIFPARAYEALLKFYEQVMKEDNTTVVLRKAT